MMRNGTMTAACLPFVKYLREVAAVGEGSAPFAYVTRITGVFVLDEVGRPLNAVPSEGASFSFAGGGGRATSNKTGEDRRHNEGRSQVGRGTLPPIIYPARARGAGAEGCFSLSRSLAHVYLLHCSAVVENRAVTAPVFRKNGVSAEAARQGEEQRYPGEEQQSAEWTRVASDQDAELRGDIFSRRRCGQWRGAPTNVHFHLAKETC